MNGNSSSFGLFALAASGLILAVWGYSDAPATRLPGLRAPDGPPPPQERQIQRSVAVPETLAQAYADGTRSPDGSPGPDYWQLQVDYVIHATLDPSTSVVSGRESIMLHNTSGDALEAIRMRFDQNLFREDAASRIDVPNHTDGMVVTALSIDGVAMPAPSGPETSRRFPLPSRSHPPTPA